VEAIDSSLGVKTMIAGFVFVACVLGLIALVPYRGFDWLIAYTLLVTAICARIHQHIKSRRILSDTMIRDCSK
jgi:hypothetical protein